MVMLLMMIIMLMMMMMSMIIKIIHLICQYNTFCVPMIKISGNDTKSLILTSSIASYAFDNTNNMQNNNNIENINIFIYLLHYNYKNE